MFILLAEIIYISESFQIFELISTEIVEFSPQK